jgi:hypothetical protein
MSATTKPTATTIVVITTPHTAWLAKSAAEVDDPLEPQKVAVEAAEQVTLAKKGGLERVRVGSALTLASVRV